MTRLALSVAALRIAGDDLIPEEVSAALGSAPTLSHRKGQTVRFGGVERPAPFGQWLLSAPDAEPGDFSSQVENILSRLTQDLRVWHDLSARLDIDIYCGWFMEDSNCGIEVSPAILGALADRRIELGVELYAPSAYAD